MKGSIPPDIVSAAVEFPVTGLELLTRQSLDEARPLLFSFSCSLRFSGLCGDTSQAPVARESASPVGVVATLRTHFLFDSCTRVGRGGHVCCRPPMEELLRKPQNYELQLTVQRKRVEIFNNCLG